MKVISKKNINFSKFNFGLKQGVVTDLPENQELRERVLQADCVLEATQENVDMVQKQIARQAGETQEPEVAADNVSDKPEEEETTHTIPVTSDDE